VGLHVLKKPTTERSGRSYKLVLIEGDDILRIARLYMCRPPRYAQQRMQTAAVINFVLAITRIGGSDFDC